MQGLDGLGFAAPILVVAITGTLLLLMTSFSESGQDEGPMLLITSLAGLAIAFVFSIYKWDLDVSETYFAGLGVYDNFSIFLNVLFIGCTALTLLISVDYLKKCEAERGEFYSLVFFAASGMMIMVSSTSMLIIFLGLEVMSICFYVLAGFLRGRPRSTEAAMKYFLMGAFATGIVFYGIVLLYGISGELDLVKFASWAKRQSEKHGGVRNIPNHSILLLGAALVIIGFAFKVAAVPFHMWAPDVYEGAPTTVTAFMATGVKAAAMGAFLRILMTALGPFHADWASTLWWLAVLTMSVGNLVALTQTNVKRMMAYSSIAHAGYMLVGLCVLGSNAGAAILYYLFGYTFMNIGAFAVISFLETKEGRGLSLDEYSGISSKYPVLCVAMAVFMFSLGGIPPTAGFMGKFYIFRAAISEGEYSLAIIGILNSLLSLFYYLRVLVRMYMDKPIPIAAGENIPRPSKILTTAMAVSLAGTLWLGLGPKVGFGVDDIWNWAIQSQHSILP